MASTFLALMDIATRHTVKIAGVGAKGAMASMTVTIDDMAVTAGKPSSEGIPQHLEHRFVLDSAALSGKNKLWQYPLLLALVALFPASLPPLLALGALYLCYEGWHESHALWDHHRAPKPTNPGKAVDSEGYEIPEPIVEDVVTPDRLREIVREAGVLDVILSAEIGIIALKGMGASDDFVAAAKTYQQTGALDAYLQPLYTHGPALMLVAFIATAGVYFPVWVLLRADNWAEHLSNLKSEGFFARAAKAFARYLVPATHGIMKGLPYIGTAAMLAVGGMIMVHLYHHGYEVLMQWVKQIGPAGILLEYGVAIIVGLFFGIVIDKAFMPLFRPIWKSLKTKYKQVVKPKAG